MRVVKLEGPFNSYQVCPGGEEVELEWFDFDMPRRVFSIGPFTITRRATLSIKAGYSKEHDTLIIYFKPLTI